jgi:hypothetical protein
MMSIYTVHIVAVFIYSYLSLCRFYTDIMMFKYKCVIYVLFSVQCALLESPSLGCDKVYQSLYGRFCFINKVSSACGLVYYGATFI